MSNQRVSAPEIPDNLEWFNIEQPLKLAELRGKVVLLNFWTSSSIQCVQNLPELRHLQNQFPKGFAIIGVHCPKFPHEQPSQQVQKAINRLHIQHPVIQDPELQLWRLFRLKSLPSLIYIDPEGHIIGVVRGEIKRKKLEQAIADDIEKIHQAGLRNNKKLPLVRKPEERGMLRFPGKLLATDSRLYISDTGRNRVLETDHMGRLRRIFGSGSAGLVDGAADYASFNAPQGIIKLDEDLYVADSGNHAIRRIRLGSGDVETIASNGALLTEQQSAQMAVSEAMQSPWDLLYSHSALYIAMAGAHQIWKLPLNSRKLEVFAGQGRADLVDGPARSACFAQPSSLTVFNEHLFIADAESSAIRVIRLQADTVATVVGLGLSEYGDREGIGREARLQYPLSITVDRQRELLWVADSYNDKLKMIAFKDNRVRDFPLDHPLQEPGGLSLYGDTLFVANTNAHEILRVDLPSRRVQVLDIDEIA